jgi:FMS-like tyrosine kinase 1
VENLTSDYTAFLTGDTKSINPFLAVDQQANFLPYNQNFEFPMRKLKMGKLLGRGAFGVVHQAVAEGIIPNEKETVVAVKVVKKETDIDVII